MDLVSTARVLTRHWLLTTVALLAAIGITGIVYLKVPTTYAGNAIVLLQAPPTGAIYHPPPTGSDLKPTPLTESNPYLSVDSSLWVLARVISLDLRSDRVKAQLESDGPKLDYEVTPQPDEPAIGIVVNDHNRTRIVSKLQAIIALTITDLMDRQQATGVPRQTWVTAIPSIVPLTMDKTKDKLKMVIAVAAVAFGAAVSLIFIVESVQVGFRRRMRRELVEKLEQTDKLEKVKMLEQPVDIKHYG